MVLTGLEFIEYIIWVLKDLKLIYKYVEHIKIFK